MLHMFGESTEKLYWMHTKGDMTQARDTKQLRWLFRCILLSGDEAVANDSVLIAQSSFYFFS